MYKSLYDDKGLVWLTHLDRVHLFVNLYVWTCCHHLIQAEDFIYIAFGSIFLKTYDLQYSNLINMTIKMMIILRIRKSSRRKHDCPVDQRLLAICQNNPFPLRRIRMVSKGGSSGPWSVWSSNRSRTRVMIMIMIRGVTSRSLNVSEDHL